jgi:hypothetical protein
MHCQPAGGGKSNDSLTEAPTSELIGRVLQEAGIEYALGRAVVNYSICDTIRNALWSITKS